MFKPILSDNSNYCNVLKHSLSDDLLPFSLNSNNQLNYDSGAVGNLTSKYNVLNSLASNSSLLDVWQPIFINNDTNINTKLLSSYGSYHNSNTNLKSCRLGIENFYKFTGNFKSFSNTAEMSIDWIINNSNIPYYLCYGILCWYRYNNFSNNPNIMDGKFQKIDSFPNGSRLTPSDNADKIYIKLSNTKLYDIDNPNKIFQNDSWTFNDETNTSIVEISSLADNITFKLAHKEKIGDSTGDNNLNPTFWISNGDCFFYYDNTEDVTLSSTYNIPPKSYISSSLYKNYSLIYRIITLDEERRIDSKNLRKSRLYRSLAHVLSTSPFITDFTIKALDTVPIRKLIQQYVNAVLFPDISASQALLNILLINISTQLQKTISDISDDSLYLDTKFTKNTFHNNIIRNKNDLFYKLLQKYGAYANITSDTTFSAKTDILNIDNRAISISQIADHYCDKTLTNQTIYNNQTITFDNTIISSNFTQRTNTINFTNTSVPSSTGEIPLYNTARPSFNDPSNSPSTFKPHMSYSGYIQRQYRQDGQVYNPAVDSNDAINNLDNVYYAQVDIDAQDRLNIDPYATHISNLYELEPELGANFLGVPGLINAKNDDNGIELIATFTNGLDRVIVIDNGVVPGMPNEYLENTMSFVWEQVAGRDGYFGQGKFTSGIGHLTQFYPRYTGKYTIKCTASTPFGSFIKYKTFYVVDGKDLNNENQYAKYWDPLSKTWLSPPAVDEFSTPLIIDKDNVFCNIIKLNKIAINNIAGVFMPIQTNCTIRKIVGDFAQSASNQEDIIYSMGAESVFKFANQFQLRNSPTLSIHYKPNNTTIKVFNIWFERIRTDDPKCSQCLSMYYPKIKSVKNNIRVVMDDVGNTTERSYNRVTRINKHPEGFTIKKYEYQEDKLGYAPLIERADFTYPQISSKFAPPIKSYGGYNRSFIDSIGADINGLTKPSPNTITPAVSDPLISNNPTILPPVTGYPLDQPNLVYIQKAISIEGTGLKIPFTKGIFHPSSGWISHSGAPYSANANKSAVLKFNPGGRDSFSFTGPQLNRLKSNHPIKSSNQIVSKTFSSTISLSISDGVRWECCAGQDAANQAHKNYADIKIDPFNSSHGYRILHQGEPKSEEFTIRDNSPIVNDEFETIQESAASHYKFAVTGPFSTVQGSKHTRIPKINNLNIKDIEVKLNFLNYVNTKNLIVWLDIEYDPKEKAVRSAATDSPLILRSKDFINQTINQNVFFGDYIYNQSKINISANSGLNDYLKNLLNFNSVSGLDNSNFKLVLLNQETIYDNGYNFSIKFTDHASKYNSLYDIYNFQNHYSVASGSEYNYLLDPIRAQQTISQNNHEILPTIAATGFSDRQACHYSSIIKLNNLNISNNTFNKFVSDSLFRNIPTSSCPSGSLDGETKFRLNIMVLDEEDDMAPLDNTINAQYLSEFETVKSIPKSTLISNSLCNWELILHTAKERDFVPKTNPSLTSYGNSDVLSLIDYKKGLSYNGHSFIADLSAYKHLLPLANYNAPHTSISDENICMEPRNDPTGQTNMQRPPVFPSWAILAIMASTAGIGAGGSLVGVLAGIAGINNDAAYSSIIGFLREVSFSTALQYEMRNVYLPDYSKYPFGSPEKILINFKTPNSLWHTAEASIFKYHNTPILKNNRYKFIRLSRHTDFGRFEFGKVSSYSTLIDQKFIKNISGVSDGTTLNPPTEFNNTIVNSGDILYDIVNSGLYVANAKAELITNYNNTNNQFSKLNKASLYTSQNSVLSFGLANEQFWHNNIINVDISGNKMIEMSGRIPYDIFAHNDSVILMSGTTIVSNTISKKALILQDNAYKSVFVMSNPIQPGYSILCPKDEDSIFLAYKNETTVQDKKKYEYNIWGINDINKSVSNSNVVDLKSTCNAIGSYGDASIFLEKNVLSDNILCNKLKNITEILNNHENDKIKNSKITLFQAVNAGTINEQLNNLTPSPLWTSNKTYGYSYNKDEFTKLPIFRKEKLDREVMIVGSADREQRMFENLQLTSAYNDMPKNVSIIRTYYNQVLPTGIQHGVLEVEGDYYSHIPIRSITDNELTILKDRLNIIKNTGVQTSLDNIVGNPDQTSTLLASDNLNYIIRHYNGLPMDSGSCYSRTNTSFINCHKKNTFNKMQQLYQEEHDITELINNQTILINNTYILRSTLPDNHPLKINTDILPKFGAVISGSGPISISYQAINDNHYWINLDPNQGCFPDYERNPRVLVKTKYRCSAANFALFELSDSNNNVCPRKAPPTAEGSNMSFSHQTAGNIGHDYTYTMSEQYVNQEMNRLQSEYGSAIASWKEITKTRFFNINGDQIFNNAGELSPHEEIVITAEETYKVAVPSYPLPASNAVDNINLPGMPSCNGSPGSPGGFGLLVDAEAGRRVGKPVSIAATVNLFDINNISVMIKKIPRMLRGMDQLSTVYRPGTISNYRQLLRVNPLIPLEIDYINSEGAINNSFYAWYAYVLDTENGINAPNQTITPAPELPNFLKLQNEMVFRSFFGSIDRIENKTEVIAPGYPWELIPFEYDTYEPPFL